VVTGSAGSSASNGSYTVSVQALAASQTVTSASPTPANLSGGSLKIELGSWDGPPATAFSPKAGATPVTITIAPGLTSLAAVRDQINAAGAGVTATIINDANGARLSMRSTVSGAENGFRMTATETTDDGDPAAGLSALNFDATNPATSMRLNQLAGNAKATINGIAVESSSNTFAAVSDGLSITVGKLSATEVKLDIADDTSAVKTGIQDFVKAFNAMASFIKTQTAYDATAKSGGPLQGDRTTIGFLSQLRGVINQGTTASTTWSRLSDIGIAMAADGTLAINSTKLDAALTKPAEVQKLLATDSGVSSSSGFMDRFRDLGKSVLDIDGSLQTREDALNAELKRNKDRQAQLGDHLTGVEARLRAQYQALDASMSQLNALSSYMTQQLTMLSNSSK
jgi:flagellar hook-associated protein 2